jgi:hypothetical protein
MRSLVLSTLLLLLAPACSGSAGGTPGPDVCEGIDCSGHGRCAASGGAALCRCDPGYERTAATACQARSAPAIAGCPVLPADHLFNTPIDDLPVHARSADYLATIGSHRLHLDLGRNPDPALPDYWGIPYNVVAGGSVAWARVTYGPSSELGWDPRPESDCTVSGAGGARTFVSPCTAAAAPAPVFPIPPAPLVEGGLSTAADHQPYGDHHLLLLDADACFLWELYHVYRPASRWDVYGSAGFDLRSSALRPEGWTSADAAGFPILPLLLRADEAAGGAIRHALRMTLQNSHVRVAHVWPARHDTSGGSTSAAAPAMGQLFRLRAGYPIPATLHAQSRAILQAMKTYGLYVADNGSDLYVQGEPSAAWDPAILDEVQAVTTADLEAVDTSGITRRAGFDPDSGRVPP